MADLGWKLVKLEKKIEFELAENAQKNPALRGAQCMIPRVVQNSNIFENTPSLAIFPFILMCWFGKQQKK